jgi:hypothetical protein
MTTAKFNYVKKDGSVTTRFILGAKIVKDLRNELDSLYEEQAKYVVGWEIDETDLTEEQIGNYREVVKDFFYEISKLEYYLRENGLDPSKVKYKTFSKESIKDITLF